VTRVWQAQSDEAEAVAGLLAEFRDHLGRDGPTDASFHAGARRLIDDPATVFLLGSTGDGDATGICQLRFRHGVWWGGTDCWLEDLFVREAARGGGLGRALAQAAVELARERGCARVQLDVAEDNAAARRLYGSLGFGSATLMLTLPLRRPGG
jgi:GNAT superfamily N-acetyltransferase